MNRAAMVCVMLALTACGGEDHPPVTETAVDASNTDVVEAGAPEAAPVEAAPPVDAGDDVTDAGLGADAPSDAMDAAPSDAQSDALDAALEAEAAPPPPVMCCSQGDDASEHTELCSSPGVDCHPGFCTIQNVLGTLAPCPVCTGVTTGCQGDAGSPLTCQSGAPPAVTLGSDLLCVCNPGQLCVYGDMMHCTAECRP
jgi:hypothetical protein